MTLIYIATRMRKELQLSKLWPMLIDTRTHTLTYIDTISLPISSNPDFCTKNFLPPSYVTVKEYCLQTGVGFGFVQHLSSSFFLSCLRFWWKPRYSPDGLPCSSNAYQAGRQGSNNQHSGHPMRQDPDCHIFGSFCLQSLNSPNFYMPTPLHRELFSSSHFSDSQPSTNHFFLKFHEIHRGVELRRPQWMCMPHVIQ